MSSVQSPVSQPRIRLRTVKPGNGKSHSVTPTPRKYNTANLSNGAPLGSHNYHNGRVVKQAFINALEKRGRGKISRGGTLAALEQIAEKLIQLALKGGIPAAREVFDRVDGRPAQMIIGDPEQPIMFKNVTEMSDDELERVARGHLIEGEGRRV